MSFNALRTAITSKLEGISDIQQVLNYPAVPSEFPAATVTPSEADSDYETTAENKRVYGFVIRLFYPSKKGSGGLSTAVDALESLVDKVVDEFDKDPQLIGENLSMPSKYTMIQLIPTPSTWDYSFVDDGYIIAEIKLSAQVSFDTT